jgi:PhnB protein
MTVTAYLTVKGAEEAIDFYTRAFGATEKYRIPWEGRVGHAEIDVAGTTLMLSDEAPEYGAVSPQTLGGSTCAFALDVPDVDAAFARAVDAGAIVDRPIKDEPYGRGGWLRDPFGHRWSVRTGNPNFNPEEMGGVVANA